MANASKSKKPTQVVTLKSTVSNYVYQVFKNVKKLKEKLELKKYDPNTKKHELFREKK
ncbi:MAG: hypothetical protein Fur0024_1440 [Patescibacteria group bacterium]